MKNIYKFLARKRRRIPTRSVTNGSTQNQQVRSTTSEWTPSDHQIVFARMPAPLPSRYVSTGLNANTVTPVTEIVQAIEEQYHLDNLQLDYERRAQERREALHRDDFHLYMPPPSFEDTTNVISNELQTEIYPAAPVEPIDAHENSFSHPIPAPRYISQDDELPSYEEAIATNNGKIL